MLSAAPLNPSVRRWILTLLMHYQAWQRLPELERPAALLESLDCGLTGIDEHRVNTPEVLEALHRAFRRLGSKADSWESLPVQLRGNLQHLQSEIGLSEAESLILGMTVCFEADENLRQVADLVGDLSRCQMMTVLSDLLSLPLESVKSALSPRGLLFQTGLLSVYELLGAANGRSLGRRLRLGSNDIYLALHDGEATAEELLKDSVRIAPGACLQLSDYPQIKPQIDILIPYLTRSVEAGKQGVNILVYGPPGTGKTQLARMMAQSCALTLHEVLNEDSVGNQHSASSRQSAYRAAQYFLAKGESMILFDEADDILGSSLGAITPSLTGSISKPLVNQLLETNCRPAIWIVNHIERVDPAFVRRFDMVLELELPDRHLRARLLSRYCEGLIDAPTTEILSHQTSMSPAVISRAAEVVGSVANNISDHAAALTLVMQGTLRAQGHPIIEAPQTRTDNLVGWQPQFVCADTDLSRIGAALAENAQASICLYGPPGSGKTSYGHWLSNQQRKPLMVYRASDLMEPYLGGTESNIARAFREAEASESILHLDEIDGFLADRRYVRNRWEVTIINEILAQMETFSGTFITTTNQIDSIDQAALRRFDLKISFHFLKPEQTRSLFAAYCNRVGLQYCTEASHRAEQLEWLTPGDFAVVAKAARFKPLSSAADLTERLISETSLKEQAKQKRIGF